MITINNSSYRKKVIYISAVILALLVAVVFFKLNTQSTEAVGSKPNIVVFLTDDQDSESMRVMTKTKRLLADRGITFSDNITSYPLCCPSRATLFTGQYAHNNGVKDNVPPLGGYQSYQNQATALPNTLKQAGYKTIHVGKYLNGVADTNLREVPVGWSEYYGMVDASYYNYRLNHNGTLISHGNTDADYLTDVLRDTAVNTIPTDNQPFFLNLNFFAPHFSGQDSQEDNNPGPPVPARRYVGRFANEVVPKTQAYRETDVTDKPAHIRARSRNLGNVNGVSMETNYRAELETLLSVDDAVEAVVNKISSLGKLDNTLFIFTSDNGYFHGEHRIAAKKYLPYEEALNTPLIIAGPGVQRATDTSHTVSNIDMAPTILDYSGVTPARNMDGKSLRFILENNSLVWNRPVLLEGNKNNPLYPAYRGIRTNRYVYIEYPSTGEKELYDLVRDPNQLTSKHRNTAYNSIKASLKSKLNHLKTCAGSNCNNSESMLFYDIPESSEDLDYN